MKITQKTIFFAVIIVLVLGTVATFIIRGSGPKSTVSYDSLASCIKDKGTTFYGAFWCPHCKAQKEDFGSSVKLLPYVECSTPDGGDQTQICKDKTILSYPTWVFANEISFESTDAPHKCTDSPDESPTCKQSFNPNFSVWVFSSVDSALVGSTSDPVQKGTTWTFAPGARVMGELKPEVLAKNTSCEFPVIPTQTK